MMSHIQTIIQNHPNSWPLQVIEHEISNLDYDLEGDWTYDSIFKGVIKKDNLPICSLYYSISSMSYNKNSLDFSITAHPVGNLSSRILDQISGTLNDKDNLNRSIRLVTELAELIKCNELFSEPSKIDKIISDHSLLLFLTKTASIMTHREKSDKTKNPFRLYLTRREYPFDIKASPSEEKIVKDARNLLSNFDRKSAYSFIEDCSHLNPENDASFHIGYLARQTLFGRPYANMEALKCGSVSRVMLGIDGKSLNIDYPFENSPLELDHEEALGRKLCA